MKSYVIAFMLLFTSAILTCCSDEDAAPHEDVEAALLKAINDLRSEGCQCGSDVMPPVAPVSWNDTLERSARHHAIDMFANHYFSHLSEDGTPPIARAQLAGYTGTYVGENIARGYSTVAEVIAGWKESESHCKNLMDTIYLEVGAGKFSDYWVLDLGRPQ
jgi:uncharacterized protein YkwD